MTQKWYATLRHPKMYPHTKFGIPIIKNIGEMDRTRRRDGRTDGLTDGRTVRLLYASQSSFGGIKNTIFKTIAGVLTECMFKLILFLDYVVVKTYKLLTRYRELFFIQCIITKKQSNQIK